MAVTFGVFGGSLWWMEVTLGVVHLCGWIKCEEFNQVNIFLKDVLNTVLG